MSACCTSCGRYDVALENIKERERRFMVVAAAWHREKSRLRRSPVPSREEIGIRIFKFTQVEIGELLRNIDSELANDKAKHKTAERLAAA